MLAPAALPADAGETDQAVTDHRGATPVAVMPPRFVTPVKTNPAHRIVKPTSEKPTGESRWLDRPQEGFTAAMEVQANEMSASKEGRKIKGLPMPVD